MIHALVLTAAGNSTRMGGTVKKEYLTLAENGEGRISVLSAALHAFLSTGLFTYILITVPSGGEETARGVIAEDRRLDGLLALLPRPLLFAEGGMTRQDSVHNGLELLSSRAAADGVSVGTVLIHDGARPYVEADTIRAVINLASTCGAAVPAIPSVDTQKETDASGRILRHLDRERIVSVQTPQGFLFTPLLEAHRRAAGDGRPYTDDTEIWGRYAGEVFTVPGNRENRKITYPEDLQ